MYRLKVNFGKRAIIGVQTHATIEEARIARDKLIELGKAAGKRTRISIVDELGGTIK